MQKVLIIDDEADFCLLLKNFLVKKDYDVYLSHTLTEGMKLLEDLKPDIIFLDNNLPDGLGWEKTGYILEKHAHTRINLISAYQYNTALISRFPTVKIWEKPISMKELNTWLA